jgi:hypothetical protein
MRSRGRRRTAPLFGDPLTEEDWLEIRAQYGASVTRMGE